MDDEQMLALKKNGGVMQVVGFAAYLKPDSPERTEAVNKCALTSLVPGCVPLDAVKPRLLLVRVPWRALPVHRLAGVGAGGAIAAYLNTLSPEKHAEYDKRMAEIDAKYPAGPRANVKDLVNHIDYAVKLIGIDHVGIASTSMVVAGSMAGTALRSRSM